MREMSRFARVSLFSFVHDDDEESRAADVPFAHVVKTARVPRARNFVRGALRLPSSRPLTHSLLDAPEARQRLTRARPLASAGSRVRVLLGHGAPCARAAARHVPSRARLRRRRFREVAELERAGRAAAPLGLRARGTNARRVRRRSPPNAPRRCSSSTSANATPCSALDPSRARSTSSPTGSTSRRSRHPGRQRHRPVVAFCGVMDYEPNVDAVTWFADHVWPRRPRRASCRHVSS